MKATVLIDNLSSAPIRGEWGLSIQIDYRGRQVLLDTGASDLFLKNAGLLGIDISAVEWAVLSHAHYDHADGMAPFFEANETAKFYLRAGSGENCYKKVFLRHKYIGLPRGILKAYKDRVVYVDGVLELAPGIRLIPHSTPNLAEVGRANRMYVRSQGRWRPDDFSHEQSLVFDTETGLVIFNSCSHAGVDNIIREVAEAWPERPIRAVVGGFHLYRHTDEEVRALARRLRDTGVRDFFTGHCTGERPFRILQEELGDRARQLHAGLTLEFP